MLFFFVLFGGIFWVVKICSDISKTKAFDRNIKIVEQAYEAGVAKWESQVVDLNLEHELSRKLKEEPEFYAATIQEMKDCFGDMFTDRIIDGYRATDYSTTALRYLLAKQGKLRLCDAGSYGIGILGAKKDSTIDMRRWEKEVNFIKWIHAEINKHGKNSILMFRDTRRIPYMEVREDKMERFSGGQFYWGAAAYSSYQRLLSPYSNK